MNTPQHARRLTTALRLAVCLSGPFLAAISAANPDPLSATRTRPITAMYPNGLRARDLMRMRVRSSTGDDVGKVKDLVLDTRSGQIVYAVVSAGGVLGVGDTDRAVPIDALHFENDRRESFALSVPTAEFQKAPAFSSEQLASLADENRSEYIFRAYHQNWQPLASANNDAASNPAPLRLASSLMDVDLRSGNETVGQSNDLVVNLEARKAAFLVEPNERFAGTAKPFVVPFNYIAAGSPGTDTISARLSRKDFTGARPFDGKAWNSTSGIYRWQVASP